MMLTLLLGHGCHHHHWNGNSLHVNLESSQIRLEYLLNRRTTTWSGTPHISTVAVVCVHTTIERHYCLFKKRNLVDEFPNKICRCDSNIGEQKNKIKEKNVFVVLLFFSFALRRKFCIKLEALIIYQCH